MLLYIFFSRLQKGYHCYSLVHNYYYVSIDYFLVHHFFLFRNQSQVEMLLQKSQQPPTPSISKANHYIPALDESCLIPSTTPTTDLFEEELDLPITLKKDIIIFLLVIVLVYHLCHLFPSLKIVLRNLIIQDGDRPRLMKCRLMNIVTLGIWFIFLHARNMMVVDRYTLLTWNQWPN
ncbi:hypothetical protein CR513_15514, partial [Mucuna pruriens]